MLRLRSLLGAVSCSVCWSALAGAQAELPPEPPTTPPGADAPPPPAPTPPAPVAPSAPPPAGTEPAPGSAPAVPPPAADSFPLPPSGTSPAAPPQSVPPPRALPRAEPSEPNTAPAASTGLDATDATPEERRPAPSEGLFRSAPASDVHHVKEDERGERTDQFKIGPVVGTGVPSVISIGGTLKVTRFLGAGVNLGLIPKVRLSYYGDATLSYQHVDVYARLYPFGGGFFLHGGFGYANVSGTLNGSQSYAQPGVNGRVDYTGVGKVRTPTLTALIGYFYTTSIGFSFGLDAGAQIPVAPSTVDFGSSYTLSTNPAELAPLLRSDADAYKERADQSVRDTLEKIGRTTIPTVNLRLGWIL